MNWGSLVNKAKRLGVTFKPVQHPWWGKYYARLTVHVINQDSGRAKSRASAIIWASHVKDTLGIKRTRIEGGSLGIFCDNAKTVSDLIDLLLMDSKNPVTIDELMCPVNDDHIRAVSADFPTVVREKKFQGKYQYRIVAHVGYGYRQDSSRLDAVMDEWERWVEDGLGEISKGALYRWNIKNQITDRQRGDYRWSGIMSFYTDDQQLSFVMQLAYPEFYTKTEKVILVSELRKEGDGGSDTEKAVGVQVMGTGDLVHES